MVSNLESLIPGLAELRATERQNRALAFSGLTHRVCGVEIRPLTPMLRLRLQLVRNAFVHDGAASRGDLFVFLWLLHPHWHNPAAGWQMAAAWRKWRLRRHVAALSLAGATRDICDYLVAQMQDLPEARHDDQSSVSAAPWVHWMGDEVTFWLNRHGGFTLESYLTTPYLVLQQVYRAWQCAHPNFTEDARGKPVAEDPQFINASDRLIGLWLNQHKKAAAEVIRSQTERRT